MAGSEKRVGSATYECLHCGNYKKIHVEKELYVEVKVCLECGGAMVDLFRIHKYKSLIKSADDKIAEQRKLMDNAMNELAEELLEKQKCFNPVFNITVNSFHENPKETVEKIKVKLKKIVEEIY